MWGWLRQKLPSVVFTNSLSAIASRAYMLRSADGHVFIVRDVGQNNGHDNGHGKLLAEPLRRAPPRIFM